MPVRLEPSPAVAVSPDFLQQITNDVRGGVGRASGGEKSGQVPRIIAGGQQRGLEPVARPHLAESDGGQQPVAETLATPRVRAVPVFEHVVVFRFPRATIAQGAARAGFESGPYD